VCPGHSKPAGLNGLDGSSSGEMLKYDSQFWEALVEIHQRVEEGLFGVQNSDIFSGGTFTM